MQVQPLGAEEGIYLLQLLIFRAGEAGRLRPGGFRLFFFFLAVAFHPGAEPKYRGSEGAGPGTAVARAAVPPPPVGCCSFLGCSAAGGSPPCASLVGSVSHVCTVGWDALRSRTFPSRAVSPAASWGQQAAVLGRAGGFG